MNEDRTGQIIAGQYRVERQLGRGAFGVVWLSTRLADASPVVLKVLHNQWARVPTVVERFRREGLAANKVNHPNVAMVYDHGTTDEGVPFIALEYLAGGTLKDELKRVGKFSVARAAELWSPVCDALQAAHEVGIVHRDLKPENVMLTTREGKVVPVVLDFGIAKFLDAAEKLTSTGTMLGTPTYMAPEQCRGQMDLGPPADNYALGAITFELLAGHPPFSGKTVAELAMKHLLEAPPALTGVPPSVAAVVASCLAKDAAGRPSAAQLGEALRQAARGNEASSPPGPGGGRGSGRSPVMMAAAEAPATSPPAGRNPASLTPAAVRAARPAARAPQGAPPPSSVAATVMVPEGGLRLEAEIARHRRRQRGPSPVLIVGLLVVAAAIVGGVVAFLLT